MVCYLVLTLNRPPEPNAESVRQYFAQRQPILRFDKVPLALSNSGLQHYLEAMILLASRLRCSK
jgi:hypothetical protein